MHRYFKSIIPSLSVDVLFSEALRIPVIRKQIPIEYSNEVWAPFLGHPDNKPTYEEMNKILSSYAENYVNTQLLAQEQEKSRAM